MLLNRYTRQQSSQPLVPRQSGEGIINFEAFSLKDIERLNKVFDAAASYRSCDYTLGGMYMWINYFGYRRAFTPGGALLVNGLSEADVHTPAYSLPVGGDNLEQSLDLLFEYSRRRQRRLQFSAVPEAALPAMMHLNPVQINELPQWADYLYSAEALATLVGKRYNKKRNHVNRFKLDNPDYILKPLQPADVPEVLKFMSQLSPDQDKPMAIYEHAQAIRLLERLESFPMEGAVLITPAHGIVAYTLGEVRGDTLHLHIEKMRHDVAGAGESINKLFAEHMLEKHPEIKFINRQDDGGDPGLAHSKMSYHPVDMVKKFEVIF